MARIRITHLIASACVLLTATGVCPLASAAAPGDSLDPPAPGGEVAAPEGPYFGQQPPGLTAELFAPGFVSIIGRYEFAMSFAPAGDRVLFTVQTADKKVMVLHTRQVAGKWTPPAPVSLAAGARKDEMEAFFSPDGTSVFFAPYDEGLDVRIWQVQVDGDGWKDPQPLRGNVAEDPAFYPTLANDGTLYYSNIMERRPYSARRMDDGSWAAQPVGVESVMHAFIAPDESFMLLDARREDSLGKADIYVSFPGGDGGWTTPVNLGPGVNSEYIETCPSLSPDGKYLFFSRYNEENEMSQIYWVDAEVIGQKRPGATGID